MKKRVVRSDLWINPVFDERLAQEQDIDFQIFPVRGNPDLALKLLSQAHVYQVSAAKDELPPEWFVSAALIAQCPQLLCVSSTGAGYDTVDVAACTAAGVAVGAISGSTGAPPGKTLRCTAFISFSSFVTRPSTVIFSCAASGAAATADKRASEMRAWRIDINL